MQALNETLILPTYKFASLGICNMYTNIPILETRHIFNNTIKFNLLHSHTNQELLTCCDTTTKQNYFRNKKNIIIQNDELAKGTSYSGILSELFLLYIEALHISHLTKNTRS